MNDVTPVRPSQFVTRDGPGSLIPTVDGMVVAPSITHMVQYLNDRSKGKAKFREIRPADGKAGLNKFELYDTRMNRLLQYFNSIFDQEFEKEIKIFRLPTNADLFTKETAAIIQGYIFPKWGVCSQHTGSHPILMEFSKGTYNEIMLACPLCRKQNKQAGRGSPVRFVQACPKGHLQDLFWPGLVHGYDKSCKSKIFLWKEAFGGGDNFTIECTVCKKQATYLGLKGLKFKSVDGRLKCQGQFPETSPSFDHDATCQSGSDKSLARLVMRNTAGLHTSKLFTTIYIPRFTGELYNALNRIRAQLDLFVDMNAGWTQEELVSRLEKIKSRHQIPDDTIYQVQEATDDELKKAVSNVIEEMQRDADRVQLKPLSESEANNGELTSLLEAAKEGFPPPTTGSEERKSYVDKASIKYVPSKEFGVTFRVTPIRELQVTKVKVGYSREISTEQTDIDRERIGNLVRSSCHHDDGNTRWHLGDQMFGEAIFVDIYDEETGMGGLDPLDSKEFHDMSVWSKISKQKIVERDAKGKNNPDYEESDIASINTDPRFVWWHSVCHNLLQNLCVDSGFSIVSLGERVYCKRNKSDGRYESGILIYTAATGADGTLGGLVSLVEEKFLARIFSKTAEGIRSCSNDPVCSATTINKNKITGSCCHACELVSETTCAYQNKFLDRNIVNGTFNNG